MLMISKKQKFDETYCIEKIQDKLAHTNKQFGRDENAQLLKKNTESYCGSLQSSLYPVKW